MIIVTLLNISSAQEMLIEKLNLPNLSLQYSVQAGGLQMFIYH